MSTRFSTQSTVIPNLNVPTAAAINAIESFIGKEVDHNHPGYDYLQRSVGRYKQAIYDLQPLPVMDYMDRHAENGLNFNEWRVFIAGLALRVLPTMGDLLGHSSQFRAGDMHTDALIGNIGDEVGGHKGYKSHIQHFFESVFDVGMALSSKRDCWMENIQTYAMMYRIIQLRREGQTFPVTGNREVDDKSFQEFEQACNKRGWALPHTVNMEVAGGPPIERWSGVPVVSPGMHSQSWGSTWFHAAAEIAALLPDEAIDFRQANTPGARPAKDPSDKREMLFRALNTLSRECSAAKGSHIESYGTLLTAYKKVLGHLYKRAMFWVDIHVGKEGVEDTHARLAREEAIALMHTARNDPDALAYALNEVVDKGYLAQQKHHWEHIVASMEKCRCDPCLDPIPTSVQATHRVRALQNQSRTAASR